MTNFICQTCGAQFAATDAPPEHCPICEDERQYVGHDGQQWTTLERLRQTHHGVIRLEEPGLTGIGTEPEFAIGQRALLVQSAGGNVMWDGVPLLNDAMLEAVRSLGGLRAITGSHPHLYSTMVDWAHAFDAPIYLPASDRDYVMRPDKSIHYWHGDTLELGDGVTVIRCGGHFEGSSVLHWANGADGRGALLTGDTITVCEASSRRSGRTRLIGSTTPGSAAWSLTTRRTPSSVRRSVTCGPSVRMSRNMSRGRTLDSWRRS
jgi:hypothetical protein